MAEPFIGEIRIISFNFPPKGWAFCNGQLLPINQNQALFALFGTMYGGNGQTTFALPNLQGKTPIHRSANYPQGATGGEVSHTLSANELPAHTHLLNASANTADQTMPTGNVLAKVPQSMYAPPQTQPTVTEYSGALAPVGGSQPHNNMQPFLTLNFIVSLVGIFPSRS